LLPKADLLSQALADETRNLLGQRVLEGEKIPGGLLEARPLEVGSTAAVDQPDRDSETAALSLDSTSY
jgi:hypothetical protein